MCHKWRCNLYPPSRHHLPPSSSFSIFSVVSRVAQWCLYHHHHYHLDLISKRVWLWGILQRAFCNIHFYFAFPKENEKCISWNPPTHVGWKYDPIRIVSSTLSMLVGISVWAVTNYRIRFSSLFTFWINWVS